ncbi:MAG: sensor histidine kinase [Halobacteriota archaeon]
MQPEDVSSESAAGVDLEHIVAVLQTTLETIEEGVLAVDGTGAVIHYNRKFVDLWHIPSGVLDGEAREERVIALIGQHLTEPQMLLTAAAQHSSDPSDTVAGTLETTDNRHVQYYMQVRVRDGQRVGRMWSFHDVTDRVNAEQRAASLMDELKRSNQDLEQFAYVASHDLQEPLRAVTGSVQLLARRYKGKLDPEADEFIGFAVDGTRRMKTLIVDLLAYSRVSTRGSAFAPVNCEAAFDHALINLQAALQDSSAHVTHDPLPIVWGDVGQLALVFQNLVSNAIKFRHSDRTPTIHVSATCLKNAKMWQFAVRDNGIGIEAQYGDRIFVVFQRLHTIDEYPGTGMGLALCMKIIQRHGGRIWVDSTRGEGSTFYFTLPSVEAAAPNNASTERSSAP